MNRSSQTPLKVSFCTFATLKPCRIIMIHPCSAPCFAHVSPFRSLTTPCSLDMAFQPQRSGGLGPARMPLKTSSQDCLRSPVVRSNKLTVCRRLSNVSSESVASCKICSERKRWCSTERTLQGNPQIGRRAAIGISHRQLCVEVPLVFTTPVMSLLRYRRLEADCRYTCNRPWFAEATHMRHVAYGGWQCSRATGDGKSRFSSNAMPCRSASVLSFLLRKR
mmetsp:Transcript_62985/g.101881  ORF Transcript_62985/g.101881 Transcript_62985/m.101881 type:complete len:221 (+) Transcript_62985:761-1423(+)